MSESGSLRYEITRLEIDLPETACVQDVADSLSVLMTRYEGLRTSFIVGPRPYQRVASVGTLMIDIYSVEDDQATRLDLEAELTKRLYVSAEHQSAEYRLAGLPTRVALAVRAGVVRAGRVEFSHLVADSAATDIIARELAELIRDPAVRIVGPPRHHPLDQAELERSEKVARRIHRSLNYWSSKLAVMPSPLYLTSCAEQAPTHSQADGVSIVMSSVATALAAQRISARTGTSRASCILGALCAALSARTGYHELVFPVTSANRFEHHLSDYIGTLSQSAIVAIKVGSASFDELTRWAWLGMLKGCRYGMYDINQRHKIGTEIAHDRGVYLSYSPVYNCHVVEGSVPVGAQLPPPECLTPALSQTRMYRSPVPYELTTPVRFDVFRLEGEVLLRGWSSDVGRVSPEHLQSLLLAVERLLVAAAHVNLDYQRIRDAVQMEPIRRGPDWVLANSQWVELTEIQRLLDDALAPTIARIFVQPDEAPLVAYVVATDSLRTPEQAHARCMALLSAHPAAMTPQRYVLYESFPTDPDDPTTWSKVASAGTGRPVIL
jgi:hypothetical protein